MEYLDDAERALHLGQEPESLVVNEIQRAREDGRDPAPQAERVERMRGASAAELLAVYDEVLALPGDERVAGFSSSGLHDIRDALPADRAGGSPPAIPDLERRMLAAWTGRVAGNMVGKPLEVGWDRVRARTYLERIGAYPLDGYVPPGDPDLWRPAGTLQGEVHGSVRDDDIDYSVLALHLFETRGRGYTSRDVAREWLCRLPVYATYTAERATYQNLVREVPFDQVGSFRNPFQEWIGALIRADVHGFAHPGDPRSAALLAYADASLSHRANGIYGAMWAAALVAGAFVAESPEHSLALALDQVPPDSRLARELDAVDADRAAGVDWETAVDRIEARHPGMHWVHTISNAGALAAAILWGEGDPMRTIALAVHAGLDTDSIGATAGAWAGAFRGDIPARLADPLEDTVRSAILGFERMRISDLARRTLALVPGR